MRKISIDSALALIHGQAFKRDNTKVEISPNNKYAYMYLFGNWIARKNLRNGNININNCGYTTTTTKDRLNAIIYYSDYNHNFKHIFQKNHTWYIYKNVTDKKGCIVDGYATPFKSRHWFSLVGDDVIKDGNEDNPYDEYNPLKSALMVSKFMELMQGDDITQANKDQKRILNTVPGLNFPSDWDTLPEDEKTKRLNKVKELGGEL